MNPKAKSTTEKTELDTDIFEAWKEYESIAMHFNELLIKLRMQAAGGLAALFTLGSVIAKSDSIRGVNWEFLSIFIILLCVLWVAIWALDFRYYNKLLIGAVDEIVRIEKLSETQVKLDKLYLSRAITAIEQGGSPSNLAARPGKWQFLRQGRWLFYILVLAGLLLTLVFSLYQAHA